MPDDVMGPCMHQNGQVEISRHLNLTHMFSRIPAIGTQKGIDLGACPHTPRVKFCAHQQPETAAPKGPPACGGERAVQLVTAAAAAAAAATAVPKTTATSCIFSPLCHSLVVSTHHLKRSAMGCACCRGPASPFGTLLLAAVAVLVYRLFATPQPTNDELWPRNADGSFVPLNVAITGASSGIGEQLAYSYARRNATVVLAARRADRLDGVVAKCLEEGAAAAFAVQADFLEANAAQEFIHTAAALLNPGAAAAADNDGDVAHTSAVSLDVLHLNHAWMKSIDWVVDGADSAQALRRMTQVSFLSLADAGTAALPLLERSAVGGRIVVSSSAAGQSGVHQLAAYSAAKHALHGFFETLQQDLTWANSSTSISLAVIGRVDTDGAAVQLGTQYAYLPSAPAQSVAEGIVNGGLRRDLVFAEPAAQVLKQKVFKFFFPELHDAAVILNSHSHPCTDSSEEMMLFNCWGPIQDLLQRRRRR